MKLTLSVVTCALCSVLVSGLPAGADTGKGDMGKTAPAIPASSGSKAEPAITEGMAHYEKGHWDIAKKHFQQAVQADPQSAEAHYDLALALDKSGDHKAAIEHFKAAQDLGKDNPQIQNSAILQAHLKAKH